MSTGRKDAWRELYSAAVLETKVERMQSSVQAAKAAIDTRLHELQTDHGGTPEERQALLDALTGLKVLEREMKDRTNSNRATASDQLCD